MRIGGLATGMDTEQLVKKLMEAERMPLDRMKQDQTKLTWQRDAFRDINKSLLELDNMMLDMKMSRTYNSKSVSSSNEGAVTATASTNTANGTYNIKVDKLASSAMNMSADKIELVATEALGAERAGTFHFSTYNEKGEAIEHTFEVKAEDTLNQVLKRITDADNNVRAFYDSQSDKVIMETTRTGNYNEAGNEIEFGADNVFFSTDLKLDMAGEKGGENASFTYNDHLSLTSKSNSYQLNGVSFQFKDVGSASLTVVNNIDESFDSIMKFIDKYNEVVETLNGSQREERFRDYPPLTEEQKKGMSEDEIELWEERAMSGILRGESSISNGLFSMRQSWYSSVETGGEFTSLTQLGIKTSPNYMDGGKLIVDEGKLRTALQENPADVQKLFSNSGTGAERGLVNRVEDSIESTMKQIKSRAGNGTDTLENYTLGKRMKDINSRISSFEDRLVQVENRYWSQFTAMEKAISRMNQQSSQLMSQFGSM
ncbi:flagellar hook-associated protein 2 [Virgibacillus sp. C22-A2]|uniref:Flagellar hook-associated protein 2 n=1 Tax=Virgibacillus tibetensis TaxID=3042313 RepID=A0ABU6KEJ2_9BACI|nr:flagellar hook-associated protein 2 [Virgibacillus sp. C22-A2]